jgi:hypothetical protein
MMFATDNPKAFPLKALDQVLQGLPAAVRATGQGDERRGYCPSFRSRAASRSRFTSLPLGRYSGYDGPK